MWLAWLQVQPTGSDRGEVVWVEGFAEIIPNTPASAELGFDCARLKEERKLHHLYTALLCLLLAITFWSWHPGGRPPCLDCKRKQIVAALWSSKVFSLEILSHFSHGNLFDVGRTGAAVSSRAKHQSVTLSPLSVRNHFSSITIKGPKDSKVRRIQNLTTKREKCGISLLQLSI